jgi:hypothetical protein
VCAIVCATVRRVQTSELRPPASRVDLTCNLATRHLILKIDRRPDGPSWQEVSAAFAKPLRRWADPRRANVSARSNRAARRVLQRLRRSVLASASRLVGAAVGARCCSFCRCCCASSSSFSRCQPRVVLRCGGPSMGSSLRVRRRRVGRPAAVPRTTEVGLPFGGSPFGAAAGDADERRRRALLQLRPGRTARVRTVPDGDDPLRGA